MHVYNYVHVCVARMCNVCTTLLPEIHHSRIRFILELLFPRGQKGIVPKDNMPINQYVKLIQFISRVSWPASHTLHCTASVSSNDSCEVVAIIHACTYILYRYEWIMPCMRCLSCSALEEAEPTSILRYVFTTDFVLATCPVAVLCYI